MGIGNRLLVVIDADVKGAIRELDKLGDKADKNLKGTDAKIDKFANNALKFGAAVTAGAAVAGVGLYKAAQQASDLNESITKSDVVFGKSASSVTKWAGTLADSFGLSKREALEAAGGFGSMFRTTGLAGGEASKMSKRMTELAGDMASFNNEDPTEMLDRLRSGLAGEAEPLRRFGVLLSEARVQAFAYSNGIAKSGEKLTEAQKVQARYGVILKDTKLQQGDFARTADGAANSQRRLQAKLDNLTTSIGQAALPVLKTATGALAGLAGGFAKVSDSSGGVVGNIALIGTAGAGAVGGVLLLAGAFAKLKVSLADNAAAMPKVAAAAKGLGALTVLALAITQVKDAYEEMVAAGEKNAGKFTEGIVPGSPDFAQRIDDANDRLQRLSATYNEMGQGDAGTRRVQAFGEVFQQIAGADTSRGIVARSAEIRTLRDDIVKMNEAAQRGYRNIGYLRNSFEGQWVSPDQLSVDTIQHLADVMGLDLFAGGRKGRGAMLELAEAFNQVGGPTEENAQKLIELAAAQGGANAKTNEGTAASKRQAAALDAETKALDARRTALLASFSSELGAAQANKSLAETLNDSNDPLERQAALLAAAGAQAQSATDQYKAMTGETATAGQQQQAFRDALIALGTQYPPLRDQVNQYLTRLDQIPPSRTTNVTATTDTSRIDALIGKIYAIAGKTFRTTLDIALPGLASGGPVKSGHAYVVGEEGPEIFTPSSSGRILSAKDSAAKLSAVGGGGGNTYVINVNSLVPTAATGDLVREALRKSERRGVTSNVAA